MIRLSFLLLAGLAFVPVAAGATDVAKVVKHPAYKKSVAVLDREHDRIVGDIVTLTEIPAPPVSKMSRWMKRAM
jgi:hypothetical protein